MKSAVRDPEMTKSGEIGQAYAFEWLEAAPDLAPYLNSFYILRVGAERVADTMPAYSGQLMITLRGEASMTFEAGRAVSTGAAGFMCPLTRAHQFELSPGTIIVGASLNFRGWASLTRLAVDENQDCYLPVERGLPLSCSRATQALCARRSDRARGSGGSCRGRTLWNFPPADTPQPGNRHDAGVDLFFLKTRHRDLAGAAL